MRVYIILLALMIPIASYAKMTLQNTDERPFANSLAKVAVESFIDNGRPIPKQSFNVLLGDKRIGTFIAGKGFNQRDDNVCFVGWSDNGRDIRKVIPTIGFTDWESEVCDDTKAVGVLSNKEGTVAKIAVIYAAASPNAIANESVIFDINNNGVSIDKELTNKIGSSGAKNLAELKKLYRK
ncbi:hypothetical protein PMPD1_0718 [Paramixta manurensis]|uniref:Uncharacterized protein n=1 Tax=Paramixta manurensis TaxID=2740817 RepID=A0A6M8UDG8_9GAMM|nr:hypothetical protein PMPD1_0718 [Erwiniaceae bacterium PD-1]